MPCSPGHLPVGSPDAGSLGDRIWASPPSPWAGSADRAAVVNHWTGICENLTAALRGWPTSEIERGVRLSEPQRVAFYEFVTSSLKAAETLAVACPAETALTPVGRMTVLRARLAAVRQATGAM